jgi:ankyrin repeat protein
MSLIAAIRKNDRDEVTRLLAQKRNAFRQRVIDEVDKYGNTPLHLAAIHGHLHFIDPLIDAGIKVNQGTKFGATPMHAAAFNGHAEIIDALKNKRGVVDALMEDTVTPVYAAASQGHVEAIRVLKNAGANLNQANKKGITPAHVAAFRGHVGVITALIEMGVDMNSEEKHGVTPLRAALEESRRHNKPEHLEIVKILKAHLEQYPTGIKPVEPVELEQKSTVMQYDLRKQKRSDSDLTSSKVCCKRLKS